MINDGTVTPNICLSWPDFLALPLKIISTVPDPALNKSTLVENYLLNYLPTVCLRVNSLYLFTVCLSVQPDVKQLGSLQNGLSLFLLEEK